MEQANKFIKIPPEFMPKIDELPGSLKDIAVVIGIESTVRLAQGFRGCVLYIRSVDHTLRRIRDTRIREEYDGGTTAVGLARKYGLSLTQINRILKNPGL